MRLLLSALVLASALALTGCGDDRWHDYNYKMTVWFGDKSYSAVRHVKVEEGASIQDSSGRRVDRSVEGEAVVIETLSGPVFALMTPAEGQFGNGYYATYVAEPALVPAIGKPKESDVGRAVREYGERQPDYDPLAGNARTHNAMLKVEGPRTLPRTIPNRDRYRGPRDIVVWPMLVRFGDIDDPNSVRRVSPESIGVTRITIEVTDEDVTARIEEKLPWLPRYDAEDRRLSGNNSIAVSSNRLSENLGTGSFQQGEGK